MPVEFINPSELSQGSYSHVAAVSGASRARPHKAHRPLVIAATARRRFEIPRYVN